MTRILLVSVESSPSAKEPPSVTKGSRPFPSARVKTLLLRKKNAACSKSVSIFRPEPIHWKLRRVTMDFIIFITVPNPMRIMTLRVSQELPRLP